jgi:diguanylate cyclase
MTVPAEGARSRRGQLVRVGGFGTAHWLAHDAFRAFATAPIDEALARVEINSTLARALGDDETGWRCREIGVAALAAAGDYDASIALAEQLMDHYTERGDEGARLQVLGQSIVSRFARGEFERALDDLTQALVGLSRLRTPTRGAASSYITVANAASAAEMFELASSQLRRGVQFVKTVGDTFLARMADAVMARNEGRWAARLEMIGRPAEASARYREALRAGIRAQGEGTGGHWAAVGRIYEALAWGALGEPELARVMLLDLLHLPQARFEPEDELVARLTLARSCADIGLLDEARDHLVSSSHLSDTTFSHQWQVALVLQAAHVEQLECGEHPGIDLMRHAAVLLATSLWEERERRLESVMVRMQMLDLAEENERVGQAATEDALTGLGNRRKLDTALQELNTSSLSPTCLLFIDLDRFKSVNDTFSHAAGDEVLKAVAGILRRESREDDVVARYGGDEFVVMLRGAPLRTGARVAERIRQAVAAHPWGRIAPGLAARVSVGVAEHCPGMTYEELMAAADSAVYEAKQAGRDRVAVA